MKAKRRPPNYWSDFENLRRELQPICDRLGRLPTHKELVREGLESLSRNGIHIHGGAAAVASRMGLKTFEQSVGKHNANHWTVENTVLEILSFMREHNIAHFPTKTDLIQAGREDIRGAIVKHGRVLITSDQRFREAMLTKKPKVHKWTEETVKDKLSELVQQLGYYPSQDDLNALGFAGLRGAIKRFGGSERLWKELGQLRYRNRTLQTRELLESPDEIKSKYLYITQSIGHPPTRSDLARLGESWLVDAVARHFGGMTELCLELGFPVEHSGYLIANDGHLVRSANEAILDNVLYALGIPHETEGPIPGQKHSRYLFDFRIRNLSGETVYVELWGYADVKSGLSKLTKAYAKKKLVKQGLYQSLGLKLIEIDGVIFDTSINVVVDKIVRLLIQNEIIPASSTVPSDDLVTIAYKPYNVQAVLDEAKQLAKKVGYLPCAEDLYRMNQGALVSRILKVGGFPLVRRLADIPSKPKAAPKWNKEKIKKELIEISAGSQIMPTLRQLSDLARFDLIGAIQRAGGYRKVAAECGLRNPIPSDFRDFPTLGSIREAITPLLVNGKLPTTQEIMKTGPSGLHRAIQNFGGIVAVAIALDLELSYPLYVNMDYAVYVARKIVRQIGYLPSAKVFRELGYDSLRQAINRHYGGLPAFAAALGVSYHGERTPK